MRTLLLTALALAWAVTLTGQAPQTADCAPSGVVEYACGIPAPEDLVVVPGDQWVVASAYAGSGGIYLVRASDRASHLAYPAPGAVERLDTAVYGACPGAPDAAFKAKFQTHGLYLQPGEGSVHRLYVVVHGAREAVEVFELDAGRDTPALTWVGCVVAPDPIGLNSVRALPDGGFVATNFLPRSGDPGGMKRMMGGEQNGELWEWRPATGWQKVPGSEAAGANGLEISEDGRSFYVAAWGTQSFFRLSRGTTPPQRRDVELGFRVDNIRWARDGSILAAGQILGGGGQLLAPPGAGGSTVVVKIDPQTLTVREIIRHADSAAFSAGTVAVEVGDRVWVGSFRGDRIATFPAP